MLIYRIVGNASPAGGPGSLTSVAIYSIKAGIRYGSPVIISGQTKETVAFNVPDTLAAQPTLSVSGTNIVLDLWGSLNYNIFYTVYCEYVHGN